MGSLLAYVIIIATTIVYYQFAYFLPETSAYIDIFRCFNYHNAVYVACGWIELQRSFRKLPAAETRLQQWSRMVAFGKREGLYILICTINGNAT